MAKQFKDETLYHDTVKERMHYLIKERINEVLTQKTLTMAQYAETNDPEIESMLSALNMAYGMELKFLNSLLLVR